MPTKGLTALPLNLMVNQKALNRQTIPEGMKEYREICAHNWNFIHQKKILREIEAMLGSVSSYECLAPHHRGLWVHRDTHGWRMSLDAKKSAKECNKLH